MKKGWIKAGVLLVVFLGSLFGFSYFLNGTDTGLTAAMSQAAIPVIRAEVEGYEINLMRGVTQGMEIQTLRDSVAPLSEDRSLTLSIDLGETEISEISYEVRSLDAEDFLESTQVEDYEKKENTVEATLHLKNLLTEDQEYLLKVTLVLKDGKAYDYVTRIILNSQLHTKEKLDFVQDFHDKTFHKDDAKSLVKNLESDSTGDNSRFQKVTIHSSFDSVTFGDLEIEPVGQEEYSIQDQDEEVAVILVHYTARSLEEDTYSYYRVEEYYRIRYTSQRIYLLDYERTMEEYFQPEQASFGKDSLNLGIVNEDLTYTCSEDGNYTAFVTAGELWSYGQTEGKLYSVFSFLSQDYTDARTNGDSHDIKILSLEDNGDMDFLVYGYMSRGSHEGEIGIGIYRFSCSANCVEEIGFLPYTESCQLLADAVGQLAYINDQSQLFLMLGGTVYNINLEDKSYQVVAEDLSEGSFSISQSGSKLAWQPEQKLYDSTQICILNLDTGESTQLEAGATQRLLPIGFMKEDFIYGVADTSVIDENRQDVPFPMYKLCILDDQEKLAREYVPEGLYIRAASVEGNVITLDRVKLGSQGFEEADGDHMVNNELEETAKVSAETVKTDTKKTQVQLRFAKEVSDKTPQLLTPKQVVYEENREIQLELQSVSQRFYVMAKGRIDSQYSSAREALSRAQECAGNVLNSQFNYVWERGHRKAKVQLMDLGSISMGSGSSSVDICANTILQMEGKGQTVLSGLQPDNSLVEVLKEGLETENVYNLTGASLSQVLYYVNRGYPVMAMMDEDTMCLIVGYDTLNTIVMNPERGEVYYVGMNDSTALFEAAGNRFFAYLE
jgi:hypothetical protein